MRLPCAPGLKLGFSDTLRVCHNTLLAHGKAVETIREHAVRKPVIGVAPVGIIGVPVDETQESADAARRATFQINENSCWNNIWFGDPIVFGRYPEEGLKIYKDLMPDFPSSDLELISRPIDFYGTNIYTADLIGSDLDSSSNRGFITLPFSNEVSRTEMDWPVVPESLYWGVRFLHERYGLPLVITENGMAGPDRLSQDGKVHDQHRIEFLTSYLIQLSKASQEGFPCLGYFQWSLLDNFEWAFGYSKRFGLVHVDFQSMKRTPKDSAEWYAAVIASNGGSILDLGD
jgi:beta-glucosidase